MENESREAPIPEQIIAFKTEIEKKDEIIMRLFQEVELLKEQLKLAKHQRFGRSTEQTDFTPSLPFFQDELKIIPPPVTEETTIIAEHQRKKPGRKPLDPNLPRVETVIDIPEEEKHCACGATLVKIGEERCEKLHHIPEKYFVEVFVRPYWACKKCEGSGDETKSPVRIAPMPEFIIPKGIATPDLLASIVVNKFCDHLPFYRQEQRLARLGVSLSRNDMASWCITAGAAVEPLFEIMLSTLRRGKVINMDETPVLVMGEDGRKNTTKSFMWLMRGGPPETPIITYHYRMTRSADEAQGLLGDFSGFLQTDGCKSYPSAIAGKPIIHVGCWAHARRGFVEASQASPESKTAASGLAWIATLYSIERELRKKLEDKRLKPDEFLDERKRKVQPVLKDFQKWLLAESETVLPKSLSGKAILYTLGQWDSLVRYIEHPDLTPDNNAAENAIRPFVVGRKNWLLCGSPAGAKFSCLFYSLIETAKANGINPFNYLMTLFHFAPKARSEKDWERLLPLKGSYNPPDLSFNVPPGLF